MSGMESSLLLLPAQLRYSAMRMPGRLLLSLLCAAMLAGCFAAPIDPGKLGRRAVSSLPPPQERLSSFTDFELLPFDYTSAIKDDADKLRVAAELENKLKARLAPLFIRWHNYGATEKRRRTLVIAPVLGRLRVVGTANRVFSGAYAGDSYIELDLQLKLVLMSGRGAVGCGVGQRRARDRHPEARAGRICAGFRGFDGRATGGASAVVFDRDAGG